MENEDNCCCDLAPEIVMSDGIIQYLNTDLDLRSAEDLTPLSAVLEACGLWEIHLKQQEDGSWFAIFSAGCGGAEADQSITALLAVIEALAPEDKAMWSRCTVKEFNLGYQCGTGPRPFTQGLSSEVVARIAAVGASMRITIYPDYAQLGQQATVLEPKETDKDET